MKVDSFFFKLLLIIGILLVLLIMFKNINHAAKIANGFENNQFFEKIQNNQADENEADENEADENEAYENEAYENEADQTTPSTTSDNMMQPNDNMDEHNEEHLPCFQNRVNECPLNRCIVEGDFCNEISNNKDLFTDSNNIDINTNGILHVLNNYRLEDKIETISVCYYDKSVNINKMQSINNYMGTKMSISFIFYLIIIHLIMIRNVFIIN